MPVTKRTRGVTRDEWLGAALDELSFGSVTDINVQALARKLGIGKSGFYWHFRNKGELLRAVLEYWVHEITEVITTNPQMQELDPETRLRKTAEMIVDYGLVRYEIGIRQWALRDREAAKVFKRVNTLRLNYTRETLAELGFEGDDLEMRAMAFVCYHTWEVLMFRDMSRKKLRGLIRQRVEMICRK